jgi:hypothetical protein
MKIKPETVKTAQGGRNQTCQDPPQKKVLEATYMPKPKNFASLLNLEGMISSKTKLPI